jgi:hypothetical protein
VVVISYLPLAKRTSYTLAYMHPACAQGESEKSTQPGELYLQCNLPLIVQGPDVREWGRDGPAWKDVLNQAFLSAGGIV